jgi:hypothetical protein
MSIDIIQPSPEQRESLVGEIDYNRRDIGLPGEPWLHSVPIARFNVEQVTRQKRSHVRVHDLNRNRVCWRRDFPTASQEACAPPRGCG